MAEPANKAAVLKPAPTPIEMAARKIKNAWIAGVISASVTLAAILISFGGTSIAGIDAWAFIDVAITLGLSYGVFRKSRASAILLLVFFVLNKLLMWAGGEFGGLPIAIVLIWFFGQGVAGTIQYHKLVKSGESAA